MAYKNIRKINRMTKELTEKNNAINEMKSEIEQIDNLKEYNEAVIKLNKKKSTNIMKNVDNWKEW